MKRLIIVFFFISAGLFGEETGLQIGNAGEVGGTFTFYDVNLEEIIDEFYNNI